MRHINCIGIFLGLKQEHCTLVPLRRTGIVQTDINTEKITIDLRLGVSNETALAVAEPVLRLGREMEGSLGCLGVRHSSVLHDQAFGQKSRVFYRKHVICRLPTA